MREIKFEIIFYRHKRDFTKVVMKHYTSLDRLTNGEDTFDYKAVEIIAKRQFTGLTDKNGVEIYEGDIVQVDKETQLYISEPPLVSVVWDEKTAAFHTSNGRYIWLVNESEVIGNIYEHPNLLDKADA